MKVRIYIFSFFLLLCFSQANAESNLNVIVSIKPYHSLVSGVMLGVANPKLLLKGNFSPHRYSLKPSDAKALQNADIVFWGGENLEGYLVKALNSLSKKAKVFSLLGINGLKLKFYRFVNHLGRSGNNANYILNLSNDKDTGQKSALDPHIWLDPENAKIITQSLVKNLSDIDPENAQKYQKNGDKILFRINELDQLISLKMRQISDRKYLVMHDAYQYFESRYQLNNVGAITFELDNLLGVRRLKKVQNMIKTNEVICVFSEPQYSQKLVKNLIKGTSVKTGELDPIGYDISPGTELYFDLINNLSISLRTCLK